MRRFFHRIPVDGLVTLFGFAGLALFLLLYNSAFPSAALHMTRSRSDITRLANQYLASMGYDPHGYQFALTFSEDNFSSIFLQRTVGIPETNRLIEKENLPFWYWRARWFRVKQQEEFSVYLMPDGKISGFTHTIPEADPGAHLEEKDALAIAENFLFVKQGWDPAQWEKIDASSSEEPNRRDYSFAWKRRDFKVGDSEIRLNVSVKGDRVGYYDYWFKVPEQFIRSYSEQRNLPNFINNTVLALGMGGFAGIAIVFTGFALLQKLSPLRGVLPLALLVSLVTLFENLNYLPIAKALYPTTQEWPIFWSSQITSLVLSVLFNFVFVALILAGGRYIARQVWPREDKVLPRGADRWDVLARSSWRGLMLGGVLLGYAVLFYLAASELFGGWTPMDADTTAGYAGPLPFIGPLYSGLIPASQEEILFRLVGVSLLLWWTKKKWVALLVPGALWAFAHLSYVRDPFYMRGIELIITAVFIEGLFFLYFDLTTTIVAHMTYNAMLGALPLLRSSDPYLIFSGVLVVVLLLSPAAFGLVRSWLARRKGIAAPACIRLASPGDLPGLAALPVTDVDWPVLLQNPCAVVLALDAGGQVAGAAAGDVVPDGAARLITVFVAPPWRGQFWGSRLVDELWSRLEPLGANSFTAALASDTRPEFSFLGMLGWQTTQYILSRQTGTAFGNYWRRSVDEMKQSKWYQKLRHPLKTPIPDHE